MKSVFITGASSGLGMQMAIEFAQRGYNLGLAARRMDRLEALKEQLTSHNVQIELWSLDVKDDGAQQHVLGEAAECLGGLDIIVANAGMADTAGVGEGAFAATRETIEINVIGAMATVHHGVALLRRQGRGRMVAIGSVAGDRGLPGAGSYSASKAALGVYMDSLRLETRNENIQITLLKPGYIDTAINQDMASRPFLVDLETGGKALVDAIEKGVAVSCIPAWPWNVVSWLMARLPGPLLARFSGW
ncbi:MAG: SDR family oxidoreductase [Cellvibrionaceae bacterium]|nr:SDR family oxidoreductase [Cellvibrionaceae bacterium]